MKITTKNRTAHRMLRVRSGTGSWLSMIHAARSRITGGHGQWGRCRYGSGSLAAIASLVLSTDRPTKYNCTVLPAGAYTRCTTRPARMPISTGCHG